MTTNLSTADVWHPTPIGPIVGEPHTPTHYCANLSQFSESLKWLYNRLGARIIGEHQEVSAVNAAADTLTIEGHDLTNGAPVYLESVGGSVPGGLTDTALYYVFVVDADTIKLKNTAGAAFALDITSTGSGTIYLYKAPDMFGRLISRTNVTIGTITANKGLSLTDVLAYVASTLGTTFSGAVTFQAKTVRSGTAAYPITRHGNLANTATQSVIGTDADDWFCPDVGQDSVVTWRDPVQAGETFVATRRGASQAFKVDFEREDASLIVRFPASSKSWCRFKASDDGGGLAWHADEYGGSATAVN